MEKCGGQSGYKGISDLIVIEISFKPPCTTFGSTAENRNRTALERCVKSLVSQIFPAGISRL